MILGYIKNSTIPCTDIYSCGKVQVLRIIEFGKETQKGMCSQTS